MVLMVLFAFIACDNGNGGGDPFTDPFEAAEQSATIPVASTDEIDFIGTWDGKVVYSQYTEGMGTLEKVSEGIYTVTNTEVTVLVKKTAIQI